MINYSDKIKIARLSNPLKMDTIYRCHCDACGTDRGYKRKVDANRLCSSCVAKQRTISEETKAKISNSVKKCHEVFHKKFGYKNNTKDQFKSFLSEVVSAKSSLT